jgi:hypothetical protein
MISLISAGLVLEWGEQEPSIAILHCGASGKGSQSPTPVSFLLLVSSTIFFLREFEMMLACWREGVKPSRDGIFTMEHPAMGHGHLAGQWSAWFWRCS